MPSVLRSQKRALAPLKLKATMWVLGIEPSSYGRVASALNLCPISPSRVAVVLGIKPQTSHVLNKHFTTELHPLPFVSFLTLF